MGIKMAIQINLNIDQGSKFEAYATVSNEDGSVFNLFDWTPVSQLRKSHYAILATDFKVEVYGDPTEGVIKLTLLPSVSNAMRPGRYVYDVEVTKNDDPENVKRVLQGTATINPNATKT